MSPKLLDDLAADWLYDVMDVDGDTSGVRPKTHVDLLWIDELVDYGGRALKGGTELGALQLAQLGNPGHMADRFHDQRADTERPDAMFDSPA